MFEHFKLDSSEDFFALGASNCVESVAPNFLNRLADFCLASDNFGGGWWKSRPNSAREIKDTG